MAKISINLATGSIQKEDLIVGIDLGTTNSLVAFINADGKPQVICDEVGSGLVPSVIHCDLDGSLLVGYEAKKYLIKDPQHTVFSIKRLLGRSYQDLKEHANFFPYEIGSDNVEGMISIQVGDVLYTPIELSSMLLKELKKRAEHVLKVNVNRAVITVPAYFNDSQRQATRDAGKLAGLDVVRILNEPTAASLAYGIGLNPDEEKVVVVYDLGGGTFDVSILKIQQGIFEVLATHGDTFLGGDDFDQAIMNYWIAQNNLSDRVQMNDSKLLQALRLKAEEAKKALTTQNIFNASVNDIHCAITRLVFEQLIEKKIQQTLDCCHHALKDAQLSCHDIDEVILVGGSTRTPLVQKKVAEFFKKPVHTQINPDEVVALGAAIQSDILAGNRKDILLLDVTPLSLGVEMMGGLMDVIIPRNSKVPTKAIRQYTTSVDGQINMKIAVYQGERDLVIENRKLAEFDLKNIPAMSAGLPKVAITFLLNADGILTVQAHELRSGVKQEVEIKPSYGLTDETVEKMLLESIQYEKEDVNKRKLIEAKTEAKRIIYAVEQFFKRNTDGISDLKRKEISSSVRSLREILEIGDKNQILKNIEVLNELTRPFAEKLMDQTIAQNSREE